MTKFHLVKTEAITNKDGRWASETSRHLFIEEHWVPQPLKEVCRSGQTHFSMINLEQAKRLAEMRMKRYQEDLDAIQDAIDFFDAADKLLEAQEIDDAMDASARGKTKSL